MGFLPSSSCINTTLRMHNMGTDKMSREKAWWELRKNAMSNIERILEAIPHETTVIY